MDLPFFSLSWELLLTIASGYAGYFVANVGMREHHKTIDVTFSSLGFGFFGTAGYMSVGRATQDVWIATPVAFLSAMIAGALWSKFGRRSLTWMLRKLGVSHSDDMPKAFDALASETNAIATQLSVRLSDGTWLMCNDLASFKDLPNGPCVISRSGDILIYITHERGAKDDDYVARDDLKNSHWGTEITLIPSDQIARVDLRRI